MVANEADPLFDSIPLDPSRRPADDDDNGGRVRDPAGPLDATAPSAIGKPLYPPSKVGEQSRPPGRQR